MFEPGFMGLSEPGFMGFVGLGGNGFFRTVRRHPELVSGSPGVLANDLKRSVCKKGICH